MEICFLLLCIIGYSDIDNKTNDALLIDTDGNGILDASNESTHGKTRNIDWVAPKSLNGKDDINTPQYSKNNFSLIIIIQKRKGKTNAITDSGQLEIENTRTVYLFSVASGILINDIVSKHFKITRM